MFAASLHQYNIIQYLSRYKTLLQIYKRPEYNIMSLTYYGMDHRTQVRKFFRDDVGRATK